MYKRQGRCLFDMRLLDAARARAVPCRNGLLVAGEEDLVFLRREVGTAGQVELFAVHVADIPLLRGGRCRRVGGVELKMCIRDRYWVA